MGTLARTALVMTLLATKLAIGQAPADAGQRSAKTLEAEGEALAKEGKLSEASARFLEAATVEPTLASAHYRFAASVFISIRADGCRPAASIGEATEHLARSVKLEKRLLRRLANDPDFEEFRHTGAYFVLVGADVRSAAGIKALLPKLRLHAPDTQDSGPLFRLEFHTDGTLEVLDHVFGQESWSWQRRSGRWKTKASNVDGGAAGVLVELDAPETNEAPVLHGSYRLSVGGGGLVLVSDAGKPFALDAWGQCCC